MARADASGALRTGVVLPEYAQYVVVVSLEIAPLCDEPELAQALGAPRQQATALVSRNGIGGRQRMLRFLPGERRGRCICQLHAPVTDLVVALRLDQLVLLVMPHRL